MSAFRTIESEDNSVDSSSMVQGVLLSIFVYEAPLIAFLLTRKQANGSLVIAGVASCAGIVLAIACVQPFGYAFEGSADGLSIAARFYGISAPIACIGLMFSIAACTMLTRLDGAASAVVAQPVGVQQSTQAGNVDALAAITQLKQLLDAGAITQAEYDAKKKELMGL